MDSRGAKCNLPPIEDFRQVKLRPTKANCGHSARSTLPGEPLKCKPGIAAKPILPGAVSKVKSSHAANTRPRTESKVVQSTSNTESSLPGDPTNPTKPVLLPKPRRESYDLHIGSEQRPSVFYGRSDAAGEKCPPKAPPRRLSSITTDEMKARDCLPKRASLQSSNLTTDEIWKPTVSKVRSDRSAESDAPEPPPKLRSLGSSSGEDANPSPQPPKVSVRQLRIGSFSVRQSVTAPASDNECGSPSASSPQVGKSRFLRYGIRSRKSTDSLRNDDQMLDKASVGSDSDYILSEINAARTATASRPLPVPLVRKTKPESSGPSHSASCEESDWENLPQVGKSLPSSTSLADKSQRTGKGGDWLQSVLHTFSGKGKIDGADAQQKAQSFSESSSGMATIGQSTPSDISSVGIVERKASDSPISGDGASSSLPSLKADTIQEPTAKFYVETDSKKKKRRLRSGKRDDAEDAQLHPIASKVANCERKKRLTRTRFHRSVGQYCCSDESTSTRRGVELPQPPSTTESLVDDVGAATAFQEEEDIYNTVESCQKLMKKSAAEEVDKELSNEMSLGNLSESDAEEAEHDWMDDTRSTVSESSLGSVRLAGTIGTMPMEMRTMWRDLPAVSIPSLVGTLQE